MNYYIRLLLPLICVALLTACAGTPKTEHAQYKDMQNTFSYYSFKTVSRNTVNPGVSLYNNNIKDNDQSRVHTEIIHSFAAIALALSMRHKWSLAEADLALESADDDIGRYLAYSALSVSMHGNGWKGLGANYAAKASVLENGAAFDEKYKHSRLTAKTVLGLAAIYRGDGPAAEELFSELGHQSGFAWLPVASHGAAIIMDGPGFTTISNLKALSNREAVSLYEKEKLAELQAIAEKHQENPEKMKASTGELAKQWSLDALAALGDSLVEVMKETITAVLFFAAKTPVNSGSKSDK